MIVKLIFKVSNTLAYYLGSYSNSVSSCTRRKRFAGRPRWRRTASGRRRSRACTRRRLTWTSCSSPDSPSPCPACLENRLGNLFCNWSFSPHTWLVQCVSWILTNFTLLWWFGFRLKPMVTFAPAALKNDACFKRCQMWLKNNYLTWLV